MSDTIVGLDIGTSFIKVVIGEIGSENTIRVIGFAKKPADGMRNGVIVNVDLVASIIRETVEQAEQMAGVEVSAVYTAIGGAQVESLNSEGDIVVDTKKLRTMEITEGAKKRAQDSAQAVALPLDKDKMHVIPQEYIVDDLPSCKDPVGMQGRRLKVRVHIITASVTASSNISECILRAGLEPAGERWLLSKTLVAAMATVHKDEFELGSILIDLGGGTTDVMVVYKDAPVFMASIPVGGYYVTNDIAIVKGISFEAAEQIKVQYGCCWILGNESEEEVIIPSVGSNPPEETTRYELCEIIQPRMDEILSLVKKAVAQHANITQLNGSIILTGGGALMPGAVQLAQSVWQTTSVRVGRVTDMGYPDETYRSSEYATAAGLVLANREEVVVTKKKPKPHGTAPKNDAKLGDGLKNLFKKFF